VLRSPESRDQARVLVPDVDVDELRGEIQVAVAVVSVKCEPRAEAIGSGSIRA